MRSSFALVLSQLLVAGSVLGVSELSKVQRVTSGEVVPGKYILELDTDANLPAVPRGLQSRHEHVYDNIRKRGITGFEVENEYAVEGVFVGATVSISNTKDAARIAASEGVRDLRPVTMFNRPTPFSVRVAEDPKNPPAPTNAQSTHVATGVDKLHALGKFGAGVKVGIIDTGVDYTHPALGGGFGDKFKVQGGYDFVGDAYNGQNAPTPDKDPLDQCAGHGTHVAGIVGASLPNPFNVTGAAPSAKIYAYRVFGCKGSVTDDVIVQALLRGFLDDVDVLTLSLGGTDGWTSSFSATVASRIALIGKIVTIAAGNDGAWGSWYSASPGNGLDVISVASTDNTAIPAQNATVSGVQHHPIPYISTFPLAISGTRPIYVLNTNTSTVDDGCAPLGPDTPDLGPYVVIVRRGVCPFTQKLANIIAKGGKAALVYNNGGSPNAIASPPIPAAIISAEDGQFLVDQFVAKTNMTLSFSQTGASYSYPNPSGGLVSTFTTYGPSNDLYFKPAIAAPGGGILSTWNTNQGSYAVLSGTSMATPLMAGIAALLFETKGKSVDVGLGARTLFETTARYIRSSVEGSLLQTCTQQGAGQVNAYDAIMATTRVSPGEFLLNDTAHYSYENIFIVHNAGKKAKNYTLTHIPAGTAQTMRSNSILASLGSVPLTPNPASVIFSQRTFSLKPDAELKLWAQIYPPLNVDQKTFPVFSGFLQIQSNEGDITHVSYLGLAGRLIDKQVLDTTDAFFGVPLPLVLDGFGNVQRAAKNYTFVGMDFPTVVYRLVFGSPSVRADVIEPNGGVVGNAYVVDYVPRNNEAESAADGGYNTFAWDGTFSNGTKVPSGKYRLQLNALKVTGDRENAKDYETYTSYPVNVERP